MKMKTSNFPAELRIKAPDFPAEIFQLLQEKDSFDKFFQFIEEQYGHTAKREAGLSPVLLESRLQDAFYSWQSDIERMAKEINSTPDHFKQCGVLAYWLRRCMPVVDFTRTDEYYPHRQEARKVRRVFFAHYSNEYLAFSLGVRICQFFETNKKVDPKPKPEIKLSHDYVDMMCSFLKRKHVSPHSLILIYRSLFQAF